MTAAMIHACRMCRAWCLATRREKNPGPATISLSGRKTPPHHCHDLQRNTAPSPHRHRRPCGLTPRKSARREPDRLRPARGHVWGRARANQGHADREAAISALACLRQLGPPPDADAGIWEGNPKMVSHLRRERAPALAKKKKAQFRHQNGKLFCEACGNDHAIHANLADSAFEVHHRKKLGDLKKAAKTKLSDLGILCASCHRVIHRITPMPTIARFKNMIESSVAGRRGTRSHGR